MRITKNLTSKTFIEELPIFASLHQASAFMYDSIDHAREYNKMILNSDIKNYGKDPFLYTDENPYKPFRSILDNESLLHISHPKKETIDHEEYVRMYTVVYSQCLDGKYKDVIQNAEGKVIITQKEVVFFTAAGSLHRVLAWFHKYTFSPNSNPLVRSFLLKETAFKNLIKNTILEDRSAQYQGNNLGVDNHFSFNQFGITPNKVKEFESNIKPKSLITYGSQGSQHLTHYGEYKDITELSRELCNYPLHIWPIGNYNCLASRVTSFVEYKHNQPNESAEFIKDNFSLLAALCTFFYKSYLEMKVCDNLKTSEVVQNFDKVIKQLPKQVCDVEVEKRSKVYGQVQDIDSYCAPSPKVFKNFGSVINPMSGLSWSQDREIDKIRKAYSQSVSMHLDRIKRKNKKIKEEKLTQTMHEKKEEILNEARENQDKLYTQYQKEYSTRLIGLNTKYGKSMEEQINELTEERKKIKKQIEKNQHDVRKQKNFYNLLISLDEDIKWEQQKNPGSGDVLRKKFLMLVKDILSDILVSKGFSENELDVLLKT